MCKLVETHVHILKFEIWTMYSITVVWYCFASLVDEQIHNRVCGGDPVSRGTQKL